MKKVPLGRPAILIAALTVFAVLVLPASAGAYIYWGSADGIDHRIGRASLGGGEVNEALISNDHGGQQSLAVDANHLYYFGMASVIRTDLDGGEALDLPKGIDGSPGAVDGEHLYWVRSGAIGRANLDGTGQEPEYLNVPAASPLSGGIAVYGGYIYWANYLGSNGDSIGRANLTTKAIENEFITLKAPGAPKGIAVGEDGIFWTEIHDGGVEPATIGTAGFTGGAGTQNHFADANVTYAGGIAVNGEYVYWSSFDENGATIARGSASGTVADPHFIHLAHSDPEWLAVNSAGPSGTPPPPGGGGTVNPPLGPPPPPKPSNVFKGLKQRLNIKTGSASLIATVAGPGKLVLSGKGIKGLTKIVKHAGKVTLAVEPNGKTSQALRKTGKAKIKATLTFTPTGGTPYRRVQKLTLKLG